VGKIDTEVKTMDVQMAVIGGKYTEKGGKVVTRRQDEGTRK